MSTFFPPKKTLLPSNHHKKWPSPLQPPIAVIAKKANWTSAARTVQSNNRTDRLAKIALCRCRCRCPPCYGCCVSGLVSNPESVNVYIRKAKLVVYPLIKGGVDVCLNYCMYSWKKKYCCSTDKKVPLLLRLHETTSTGDEYSIIVAEISLHVVISAPITVPRPLLRGAHLCFRFGVMLLHYSLPLFSNLSCLNRSSSFLSAVVSSTQRVPVILCVIYKNSKSAALGCSEDRIG